MPRVTEAPFSRAGHLRPPPIRVILIPGQHRHPIHVHQFPHAAQVIPRAIHLVNALRLSIRKEPAQHVRSARIPSLTQLFATPHKRLRARHTAIDLLDNLHPPLHFVDEGQLPQDVKRAED